MVTEQPFKHVKQANSIRVDALDATFWGLPSVTCRWLQTLWDSGTGMPGSVEVLDMF